MTRRFGIGSEVCASSGAAYLAEAIFSIMTEIVVTYELAGLSKLTHIFKKRYYAISTFVIAKELTSKLCCTLIENFPFRFLPVNRMLMYQKEVLDFKR